MRWLVLLLVCACGSNDEPRESPPSATGEQTEQPESVLPIPAGPVARRASYVAGPVRSPVDVVPRTRVLRTEATAVAALTHGLGAAGTDDGLIVLFDVPSGRIRATRQLFGGYVESIERITDHHLLLIGSDGPGEEGVDNEAEDAVVWNLEEDRIWRVDGWVHGRSTVATSADGRLLAIIDPAGVRIHGIQGREIGRWEDEGRWGRRVFLSPGQVHVVDGTTWTRMRQRDFRPAGETWELPEEDTALFIHPRRELVAYANGTNVELHALDGELKHTIEYGREVRTLQWSSDGTKLAVCGGGASRVYHGESWSEHTELPVRGCGTGFDLRGDVPASFHAGIRFGYTPADGESVEFGAMEAVLAVGLPPRGQYALLAEYDRVSIANFARQRVRRLISAGPGLGAAADVWEVAGVTPPYMRERPTPSRPSVPAYAPLPEGLWPDPVLGTSPDRLHRIVRVSNDELYIQTAGARTAIKLVQPGDGFALPCFAGDEIDEHGSDTVCQSELEFAPDSSRFAIGTIDAAAMYDNRGRRLGAAPDAFITFSPTGRPLALREDGSVAFVGNNLRTTAVVLRPRARVSIQYAFSEDGSLLAVARGRALVIYDAAANARKQLIELPRSVVNRGNPFMFRAGGVQVQLSNGFVTYSVEDGSQMSRIVLDETRGINQAATHVAYCVDGRLKHRALSEEAVTDLGACPAGNVLFNDRFAWWADHGRQRVIRFSDGEQLILSALAGRRPVYFAFTARGHLWVSDPDQLGRLRVRAAGPIPDASIVEPTREMLSETLVADFMAGEELGAPPTLSDE